MKKVLIIGGMIIVSLLVMSLVLANEINNNSTNNNSTNPKGTNYSRCILSCVNTSQVDKAACIIDSKNISRKCNDEFKICVSNIKNLTNLSKKDLIKSVKECNKNFTSCKKNIHLTRDSCIKNVINNSKICKENCKLEKPCPANYNPVCGVDNKTYSNECELKKAGVEKDCRGECPCKTNKPHKNITDIVNTNKSALTSKSALVQRCINQKCDDTGAYCEFDYQCPAPVINNSIKNPKNNSVIENNSKNLGKYDICFPCGDSCIKTIGVTSCIKPDGSFRCEVINNICTKILLNNNSITNSNNPTFSSPGENSNKDCLKEGEFGIAGIDKCCSGLKTEYMQTASIDSVPGIACTKCTGNNCDNVKK